MHIFLFYFTAEFSRPDEKLTFCCSFRSSESDVVIRHKVKTIFQKIQSIMVCPFFDMTECSEFVFVLQKKKKCFLVS